NVVGQNTAESNPATLRVGNVPVISNVIVSPASGNVPATGFLSMTVVMESGDTPFLYQWYLNGEPLSDDAHLSGSNGPTLSVISATLEDAGLYSVEVSNDVGSDSFGTIPITVGLFITHNLQDEITEAGKPFSWSVKVSGGMGSIEYQWLKEDGVHKTLIPLSNGNGMSGTDTDTLVIDSVDTTDEGYYAVEISDDYSSVSTRTASLRVVAQLPLGNGAVLAALTSLLALLGTLFAHRCSHEVRSKRVRRSRE
nr:immunoglobulin domain-containing protein [Candidatus Hydrogenedentota bacterium]